MDHHGGAVCRVQRRGYSERDKTLTVPSSEGACRGCCQRILFNYVNQQRKKLIKLTHQFILSLYPCPTRLPPKRWYCHSPALLPRRTSSLVPPLSRPRVFGWLLNWKSIRGHLRPQWSILNHIFVVQMNSQNDGAVTPRTFHPSRASSTIYNPPRMPTSIWLLYVFRKWRPPKANAPPISLFFDVD